MSGIFLLKQIIQLRGYEWGMACLSNYHTNAENVMIFLRFTSGIVKSVCDFFFKVNFKILNFVLLRILWLLLFYGLRRKITQSLHLLFCLFFLPSSPQFAVVPESMML